jgi:hypothetical protein
MSEALVVQPGQGLVGGVGLGSSLFKAKPMMLELVHKSSRQENVRFGEFRIVSTNEALGKVIRVVLLAVPQVQREWFIDKTVFTKENKGCFSLDGIMPHPNASQPPALYCATCSKGDLNWVKWRKTHSPDDLPPCGAYFHLLLALRDTQMPAYLNVKGKSYLPFQQAMQNQMAGLLAKLVAQVKANNKLNGYTLMRLQAAPDSPIYEEFRPTPGFVVPAGETQKPLEPMPNIYDISFNISVTSKDGGSFFMKFDDFKLMRPEDRAEFGQLYLDIMQQKIDLSKNNAINEEAEIAAAVSEAAADAEFNAPTKVAQEILPPITI